MFQLARGVTRERGPRVASQVSTEEMELQVAQLNDAKKARIATLHQAVRTTSVQTTPWSNSFCFAFDEKRPP